MVDIAAVMLNSRSRKTKRRFRYSEAERARVLEAVKLGELHTTGEIVPWIVPHCKRYRWVHVLLTLIGLAVATAMLAITHRDRIWDLHFAQTVAWQTLGAWCGLALSLVPTFKRIFIPKHWMAIEVHQRALASFVNARLTETADRNGVLIFIALFERRVEILADRGLNEKLPRKFWDERVAEIIQGVHNGTPIEALCHAIYAIGGVMGEHFPKSSRDGNELSDELRED